MDNYARANNARVALDYYLRLDEDLQSAVSDLLTDIMHLTKEMREEIDFASAILTAEINFESEEN